MVSVADPEPIDKGELIEKTGLTVEVHVALIDDQGLTVKGALIEESRLAAEVALMVRSGPAIGVT